ncbi:MAG TPA: tetratricopeptide repeat protein [Alloacidobacterium sp.]|nr:tetratricopeptide repeat protein [Alloacidobacterium sp.]
MKKGFFISVGNRINLSNRAPPIGLHSPPNSEIIRSMDKIAALTEILTQDPTNAFARYGLAMEHASQGNTDTALSEFQRLVSDHPDYTAGYFMAAQTLAKAGRADEAKLRLAEGIASARRTGNQHALSEMQAMLDDLELGA